MRVNHRSRLGSLQIAADRSCLVSRSGTALVPELAARLGLERELSGALARLFVGRPRHDPGRVLIDLATTLVDGGDCVSDLGALAEQPDLFGRVASHSTVTRLLYALGEEELRRVLAGPVELLGRRRDVLLVQIDDGLHTSRRLRLVVLE